MSLMLLTLTAVLETTDLNLLHELTLRLVTRSATRLLYILLETLGRLADCGHGPVTKLLIFLLEFYQLFLRILKLFKHGTESFHDFFADFKHMVLANVSRVCAIGIADFYL